MQVASGRLENSGKSLSSNIPPNKKITPILVDRYCVFKITSAPPSNNLTPILGGQALHLQVPAQQQLVTPILVDRCCVFKSTSTPPNTNFNPILVDRFCVFANQPNSNITPDLC